MAKERGMKYSVLDLEGVAHTPKGAPGRYFAEQHDLKLLREVVFKRLRTREGAVAALDALNKMEAEVEKK